MTLIKYQLYSYLGPINSLHILNQQLSELCNEGSIFRQQRAVGVGVVGRGILKSTISLIKNTQGIWEGKKEAFPIYNAFNGNGDYKNIFYLKIAQTCVITTIKLENQSNDDEVSESLSSDENNIYTLIEPRTFVGLHSLSISTEPIFIAEIVNKHIAYEAMLDYFGHAVFAGDAVVYLDSNIGTTKIKYKCPHRIRQTWMRCSSQIFC